MRCAALRSLRTWWVRTIVANLVGIAICRARCAGRPWQDLLAADTHIDEFVSELTSLWPDVVGLTIADVEKVDGSSWVGPLERSPAHTRERLVERQCRPCPVVPRSRAQAVPAGPGWQSRRAGRSFGRAQWVWLLL
jgi:hypothetical protein